MNNNNNKIDVYKTQFPLEMFKCSLHKDKNRYILEILQELFKCSTVKSLVLKDTKGNILKVILRRCG